MFTRLFTTMTTCFTLAEHTQWPPTLRSQRQSTHASANNPSTLTQAADGTPDPHHEAGMATAEYAIGTLAAAAFALLLLSIARSDSLRSTLEALFTSALSVN